MNIGLPVTLDGRLVFFSLEDAAVVVVDKMPIW